jgi:hypothetical protein
VEIEELSMKTAMRKATEAITSGAALYWELARSALRLLPRSAEVGNIES